MQLLLCKIFSELIKASDIISLHTRLTDETKNIIDITEIDLMQDKYFLNTSRGKLVNEEYLYKKLVTKEIKGAGLDVFVNEPSTGISTDIRKLENVVTTCHTSAYDSYSINPINFVATATPFGPFPLNFFWLSILIFHLPFWDPHILVLYLLLVCPLLHTQSFCLLQFQML